MRYLVFRGPDYGLEQAQRIVGANWQVTLLEDVPMPLAEGLVDASPHIPIKTPTFDLVPNIRVISCASTGTAHIDAVELSDRRIVLLSLAEDLGFLGQLTTAAEHTWALILALSRQLVPAVLDVRKHRWNRELFPALMLSTKTLGIVGFGRIGQMVAGYADAFRMRVIAYDPKAAIPRHVTRASTLDALLGNSDLVTMHVPRSAETHQMANSRFFSEMAGPNSMFINTSQSSVVDEEAILEALESGKLGGAALDVLEGEPNLDNNPLVRYASENSNLLITPHCAGYSPEAVSLAVERATQKALDELNP